MNEPSAGTRSAATPVLASMTGFARRDGVAAGVSWLCEIRSVNGRSLDLRCRLPMGFDAVEALVRTEAQRRFRRGSITVSVSLTRVEAAAELRVNWPLLDRLITVTREASGREAVQVETLLGLRGVVETATEAGDGAATTVSEEVARAVPALLEELDQARREEGARLAGLLDDQIDRIAALTGAARQTETAQPAAIRDRLTAQLAELLDKVPVSEERLAQEVALLVARADVREELDRLDAHIGQARALLAEGGAVGRRLDFLAQEFNREANTLCSKAADIALTRLGLDLKAVIEQFREQIQNIE